MEKQYVISEKGGSAMPYAASLSATETAQFTCFEEQHKFLASELGGKSYVQTKRTELQFLHL